MDTVPVTGAFGFVGSAFAATTIASAVGDTLLIGGDDTRVADRAQGQPRQRRCLVQHRLDEFQPRPGSAEPPTSFAVGSTRRERAATRWSPKAVWPTGQVLEFTDAAHLRGYPDVLSHVMKLAGKLP